MHMQALRLARPILCVRRLATAAHPASTSTASASSIIPLSNVEAQWEKLSKAEQASVHRQLEEVQKKDWKLLSMDEKKAAYYVAFGPHGPRTPLSRPGDSLKVFLSVMGIIAIAGAITMAVRGITPPAPKTINREWEEASTKRAVQQKTDPFTGVGAEGYSGKGFVQH